MTTPSQPQTQRAQVAAERALQHTQDKARAVGSQLGDDARDVLHAASGQARRSADAQVDLAGREARILASVMRTASNEASQQDALIGAPLKQVAAFCEDLAARVEGKDAGQLLREVEAFGRDNPTASFGAAVALGFLSTRFVRAGVQERQDDPASTPGADTPTLSADTPDSDVHARPLPGATAPLGDPYAPGPGRSVTAIRPEQPTLSNPQPTPGAGGPERR